MKCKSFVAYLARYPLYPGFISGGERHFIELAKRAAAAGIEMEVLTCPVGEEVLRLHGLNPVTYKLSVPLEKFLGRWHNIGISFVYLMRIVGMFFRQFSLPKDYDLIITTSHFLPDVLPGVMLYRRNPKSKLVVYLHHLEPLPWRARGRPLLGRILSWLNRMLTLRLIKRYAQVVITVNHEVKQELIKAGITAARIHIFPNGVDVALADAAPRADKEYEVCYFGRLAPTKGIFDIIDIWSEIINHFPKAKVAIIGGNGEKFVARLRGKIKEEGLEESILLLGVVPEETKYSLIKACQISISPSYEEGWGIALCETFACGLPVVAYDLSVYHVFGNTAMLRVPIGDKKAFARALLHLLSDEGLRRKMGKEAKEVARCFSWDEVARAELALLTNLSQEVIF